jgi:hypothetical protein
MGLADHALDRVIEPTAHTDETAVGISRGLRKPSRRTMNRP